MFIPIHKLKKLFLWKTVVVIPMSIAMTIWICAKAGTAHGVFNQPGKLHGANRGWLWVSTFCSLIDSWLTVTVNMPDFSRYSRGR